ncbi:PREDICTED: ninein [Polistes dominula]|uniref:Ninein n=1 Tax=Polistes dominula TaxID=743375 RepID=A0ABM1J333_POLDO|nr:PREDICTED: ninein [Polistes dominula]XP_015186878.1 PREDICTED: ninein [Polistes dominula]XP_015186887.1 PREDICTED: ninein [Polistes dominula]XP_015186897.1 PREDICTED: ninein [Polistes dominula]XP_015186907.1 PREDICTED: ninein [Polistes dominula]XP_015186916.1 PREDICTED: ninein [Polistes dominula]
MDEHNNGHYEQQLLAVFESCLMKGQTELKEEDLSSLCNKLQLDDHGDELKECIKKCIPGKCSISFQDFRGGLLLLLAKTQELLTQDSDIQQSHMNDCNTKTGLILDKNRLKDLWHKVNVCFKENADTSDKYFMSNHRETSALPEQIAQRIFEKLDQNSDGLISLDEFLDIFKNQTILQEELILPCKDISEKCLTNSKEDKSDYDTLQHRDSGFIQHSIVTDMWKMAGISDAASLLSDLGYNTSSINLNDLVTTLCDELKSLNDSIINTDIQPHISLLKGVLILYKEELRNLNILIENITGERDKLRVDLIEANERANSLAQEIDDHHFRQEEIKQNLLKQIEHKHSEIIKDLSNQLSLERESNATTLKVKELQLQTQQQENYQNKNKLLTALQDNQILESENENLRNQIDKLKESNTELLMRIKMLAAEHDEVEDIDAKKEEQVLHLIDRMKQLQSEIVSLRDHNDELTIQLDISRSLEDETNLRAIKNEVDTAVTSEMNTNIETTSQQEEIISCSNNINNKIEVDRVEIDTTNNKEQIICDLKNMLIKCENCSCENCDYKEAISSIICGQSNFNSFSLNDDIDFSKSLASELETECEERTSESLRDFVVSKSNKTTTSSTKRAMHNSNDSMIYPTDTNFTHADIKLLQNKITSLRDYPPRKEEYSITDHIKNLKDKDITSNYSVPCNDPDKKNNMTLSNSDNSLTNLVYQEQENWWQMEKKQLTERCLELEKSLDLLKAEYEECEEYWAAKLEEERQLFEQEQKISDEKFSELIAKMAEYEELISPVDKVKNGGRLSPIEEKYNLEQQYLDLEEEFDQWKIQMEKDISEKNKEIKSLFEKLKKMEKIKKMDNSTQVSDDIFQPVCTFCDHIPPMDAFNVESYTQLQSKTFKYDGDTCNNVTDRFKGDHIFKNPMPSNHFTSQVTKEDSVGNYHLDQLSCIKQDTNSIDKCEKSESEDKGLNNISEHTFIEKEGKRSKSKHNTSNKDYSLIQELIKSQISNGIHCQCLQDTAQKQVCNIDINILESLTMKLQIQERKKRQLEEYFRQQQHHIEQVLHQTLSQHQIEVCELRCLLYNTQEKLQVQIQANTEQAKRLAGADILAKDLFIENAYLIENLKRLKQHCLLSGVNCESTSI